MAGDGLNFGNNYNPGWGSTGGASTTTPAAVTPGSGNAEQFRSEVNSAGSTPTPPQTQTGWGAPSGSSFAIRPPVDGNLGTGYDQSQVKTTQQYSAVRRSILGS